MSYRLTFATSAHRDYHDLPERVRAQVVLRLDALTEHPRPAAAKLLVGQFQGHYRLRVGDYRVVYYIDEAANEVVVTRLRHRSQVYK